LLQKAKRLGVREPADLEKVALARGLRHFGRVALPADSASVPLPIPADDPDRFTNEELAIALMSPSAPYSLNRLRMAGALLGAAGVSASKILNLARQERCEMVVRHIALQARMVEPENMFWRTLLDGLPESQPVRTDVLPHLTRLVAMSGVTREGRGPLMQWIRPVT
jgi:hypothetical protein